MTNSRVRLHRRVGVAVVGSLLLAACADDKPLNTFEPRGPKARAIDELMYPFIWWIMGLVFVAVIGGALWLTIKHRVKPEDFDHDDLPYQRHGNDKLEIGWTILPAVLLAVVAVPTVIKIWELETKNDPGQLDVLVIGQQWWWEYRYDVDGDGFFRDADGDGEVWGVDGEGGDQDDREWPLELSLDPDDLSVPNELVIPAGVQVDLTITSRDVIHSFWIPRLNGNRDAVPGRFHTWSLEADDPGKYTGWCTEFCGLSHARMRMSTVALSEADFDAWFAGQVEPAAIPAESDLAAFAGRTTFQAQCASCHVVRENELDVFGEESTDPYFNPYNLSQEAFEEAFSDEQRLELGEDPSGVAWATSHPLVAKVAPDLTHFASRSVFAGAIYSQYAGVDADDDALLEQYPNYLDLSEMARFNEPQLRRWIRNAPGQKAMDADGARGMPAFPGLAEADIDNLVAYLATLD
jgi:cytochrome c oxidase subunit 2